MRKVGQTETLDRVQTLKDLIGDETSKASEKSERKYINEFRPALLEME